MSGFQVLRIIKLLEFELPISSVVCNRSTNCATAQKVSAGIKEDYSMKKGLKFLLGFKLASLR